MRQIGTLPDQSEATRFTAYLVTQGIVAHADEKAGAWGIWVRDEDHLERAKQAFSEFLADPTHARYRGVERTATEKLREENAKREAAQRNVVQMRNRWGNRGPARSRPLTIAVVLLCGGLGVTSGMRADPDNQVVRTLLFADPNHVTEGWEGRTLNEKLIDVRQGEWWRIITPAFLHGSVLHLAFNVVMFYQLGGAIEYRRSTWQLGLMILAIATCSNLAQALAPNELGGSTQFVGLSGVVYGLFGYMWMKSRFDPSSGLFIDRGTVILLLAFLFLGFLGVFDRGTVRIANWAHGVGCLSGILIGIAPVLFRPASPR